MALMERVATLVRANLNDLIEQAEEPEKMLKQVMLDMQNQLMQVKTQVAIAIADQHLLAKKQAEQEEKAAEWVRKAELAVKKKEDDDLARIALDRSLTCRSMAESLREQAEQQTVQVENLKVGLRKLEEKLAEAHLKQEVLVARNRRANAVRKAGDAGAAMHGAAGEFMLDRLKDKVLFSEASSEAGSELAPGTVEDRLAALGKQDQVEQLLAEIKARKNS